MKTNLITGTIFALFVLSSGASANPVPLQVNGYNFQLDGGGGGAEATLNGVSVEIYCDDFANDLHVPSTDSADVTQLSTTANLDPTRFGEVTSWTAITLSSNTTDQTFLNSGAGTAAEARYAMVAWLVSQYNVGQGNSVSNNQIQEAIWTLMDPASYAKATSNYPLIDPSGVGQPTADLVAAANWYLGGGATNSFLSQFEVVSDANMTAGTRRDGWVGYGGFQEQIVYTPAPEPRGGIWLLMGLLGLSAIVLQRARARRIPVTVPVHKS